MTSDAESDSGSGPIPPPPIPGKIECAPPSSAPRADGWEGLKRRARILLARNPFYIVSAMLLIWSMRRLSLDSRIFRDELPQLLFNFSSFQVYEWLLAATAIVLARRRVWYDSGLLVALENLFICVPFLLVSQALLLENGVALALCLAAGGLALLRVAALKRRLAELNMPASLLWVGAFLLCFNLAWPLLIRHLHQNAAVPAWDRQGLVLTSLEWNWMVPAAAALAVLLPSRPFAAALPADEETPFYAWRSFPVLALLMWVAGTCVHLYCISYVYGLPWNMAYLAPGAWMASWILWRHLGGLAPENARAIVRRILLLPPAAVMLTAVCVGRDETGLTLAVLNVLAFGAIAIVQREWLALHLGAFSALLFCGVLSHPGVAGGDMAFGEMLLGGGLVYTVAWAVCSARPKLGMAGGICLGFALAGFMHGTATDLNFAVQAGLIFILLHSLRWSGDWFSDAAKARTLCGVYWLIHTIFWVAATPSDAIPVTMACGGSVVVVYVCARFVLGMWGPRMIAYSGGAVLCCGPIYFAGERLLRAPEGVLALLGSFALFALGTFAALGKARLLSKHHEP